MSADTSTSAARQRFVVAIENTGHCSADVAQAVAQCPLQVGEIAAALLGFHGSATYAQAAEQVMLKHRNHATPKGSRS